ncbi:hypothetical protein WMW72_32515 [Paenibacillus filicis]|uniref:Sugar ABC transporter permease n=1 Tax=Paenibacillus filicis TaxID=669464 RepID=A0ABU9DWY2_9BACL
MEKTVANPTNQPSYKGLILIIVLFCVALFSPLFYFLIHLILGNEAMFLAPLQ